MSILLDAGPSLNFLAVGQQNVLIKVAASHNLQIQAPERVDVEIEGMCKDPRFKKTKVRTTWGVLKASGRVKVVSDELATQQLTDAVARTSGMPAQDRINRKKSLGEIMVIAHASVYAQQGEQVFVLIDEGDGRKRTQDEQRWLQRNNAPGTVRLWNTRQVLQEAQRHDSWIVGGLTWEAVYDQMRKFDDGLPARPRNQGRPAGA